MEKNSNQKWSPEWVWFKMKSYINDDAFNGELAMIFGTSLLGALIGISIKNDIGLIRTFLVIAVFLILIGYSKKNKSRTQKSIKE